MREQPFEYTLGGMQNPTLVRRISLAVVSLAAAALLAACGGGTTIQSVDASAFSAQAQAPDVTVIDVRTPDEFAAGHIANAVNLDVEGGNFDAGIANLDKSKTYAVYCHSGRRSMIAANTMADAGFTAIYNLDGGVIAWQSAGLPLVTG